MSFWAIELEPGKAHETIPPFDLHVTQAVLGAKAKDQARTVVQCTVSEDESEEGRGSTFAIASLKLDLQENANLDLIFEAGKTAQFSAVGKNAVTLLGYYINDEGDMGFDDEDDEDIDSMDEEGLEGLGGSDDDELDQDGEDGEDDDDEEEVDEEEIQALQKQLANQNKKRQAEPQAQNGSAKKAKTDAAPQQNQQKAQTPQPKQQGGQQTPQPKQQGGQQQQKTPQQQGGQQKQQTPGAQKQGGQQQKGSAKKQTPK